MLSIRVVRAHPGGRFTIDYEGRSEGNRVESRLLLERLQSQIDDDGEPLRAYLVRDGIPIEAAFSLREARD